MKHLTSLFDVSTAEVNEILKLAEQLKSETKAGTRKPLAAQKVITQVFEKPSLRTRVSFEAGISQLGGTSIFLKGAEAGLNGRETLEDVARVLGSYSDVLILRTFSQQLIEQVAQHAGCPVINALSDEYHPCQALTDVMTIKEHIGNVSGKRMTYVGDGNNVAKSLAIICGHLEIDFTIAAPDGYFIPDDFTKRLQQEFPSFKFTQTNDLIAAVADADVIYTDVWASMGQEQEKDQRAADFAGFQVNTKLLDAAGSDVLFMHCLPARRGLEVTEEAMTDSRSIVFEQAENRMHLAKGLLVWLLNAS